MNGEEEVPIPNWLKNINYIISGLSIIVYIFYTYLLLRIKLKNWDYSLLIKAYLVFISFCQSLYYFFSPDNKTMCKLLGSFDIFLDYVKISLSINILLLNTNDKISMNININNKTIFIINFIFNFLVPLCFGEIVFLMDDAGDTNESLEVDAELCCICLVDLSLDIDDAREIATKLLDDIENKCTNKITKNGLTYESISH